MEVINIHKSPCLSAFIKACKNLKLYNLRFLQALREADKKDDLCMLLTSIYYGAAKMMQKSTDLVGPFLKLS